MPGVPLDDELLAAPAVGLPVGVGIYYAWVRRDWTGQARAAGFAAAVAAALLGAWLGLHAAAGLLALPTAIVGAIAAANLILLLRDIASDREHRDVYAEAATTELRQARATVPEPQRVA
jgi:hypothetical protein